MIYDITLPISPELAVWPGDTHVNCEKINGDIQVSNWSMGSHVGTHIDAPKHLNKFTESVDDINLEVLNGKCRIIEINAIDEITAEDLMKHKICKDERILIKTNNSSNFMKNPTIFPDKYIGLNPDAAKYLADTEVMLVGIDFLSIEAPGYNMMVHYLLLRQKIVILEGLDLRDVNLGSYELICAPLKLKNSDGAPARVFLKSTMESI